MCPQLSDSQTFPSFRQASFPTSTLAEEDTTDTARPGAGHACTQPRIIRARAAPIGIELSSFGAKCFQSAIAKQVPLIEVSFHENTERPSFEVQIELEIEGERVAETRPEHQGPKPVTSISGTNWRLRTVQYLCSFPLIALALSPFRPTVATIEPRVANT